MRTTDDVNLRAGPSTDSELVAVLPAGTELEISGHFVDGGEYDWWPVSVIRAGQAGFLPEEFLEEAT